MWLYMYTKQWLPACIEQTSCFVTIGFQADAGKFFLFMLAVFAQNLAISGIVYSIAAQTGVFSAAQTIVNVVIVFAMVCMLISLSVM